MKSTIPTRKNQNQTQKSQNSHLKAAFNPSCLRLSLAPGPVFLFLLLFPLALSAQQTQDPQHQKRPQWINPPEFIYSARGKPDPFRPIIQSQPAEDSKSEESKRLLSPLEKVQPSQLDLVGILNQGGNPDQNQALVELPDGKGYILRIGVPIGTNQGKVTAITRETVVIQETLTTIFGKEKKVDTILKLHKQPGPNNG